MTLPAVREVSSLVEYHDTPGSELMGFLAFLKSELVKAVDILREETEESLNDGDASSRIQIVNRLRLRKNRLEAHLVKEIREVRDLARTMVGQADKSVVDAVLKQSKVVYDDIKASLKVLVEEFGVD